MQININNLEHSYSLKVFNDSNNELVINDLKPYILHSVRTRTILFLTVSLSLVELAQQLHMG